MPNVTISIGKRISDADKNALQLEVGNIMSLIPSKTIANTLMTIDDGRTMFKNGEPIEAVFVDVRLYKNSPEEGKKAFSEKLFEVMEKVIAIPPERVQINFIELPNWASNGNYK